MAKEIFLKKMAPKKAMTTASSVAMLWGVSILATYQTIDALLNQHQEAQVSVTSATMAYILREEIEEGRTPPNMSITMTKAQAEYTYYDQLVKISSGSLPGFHDALSKGHPYKDAKNYYMSIRNRVEDFLHASGKKSNFSSHQFMSLIVVVDSSGSMSKTDPTGLRKQALKMMIDRMKGYDKLGVIEFSKTPLIIHSLEVIGGIDSSVRKELKSRIDRISAKGGTNIRHALNQAAKMAATNPNTEIILLSDGADSGNWKGQNDMIPHGIPVHTVALSKSSDRNSLSALSASTGGICEVAVTSNDLQRIIANLFGKSSGEEILMLAECNLYTGEEQTYNFTVEPGVSSLEALVTWPGSDVDLCVVTPDGRRLKLADAIQNGQGLKSNTYALIKKQNPAPGVWRSEVRGIDLAKSGESVNLRITAKNSSLRTSWMLTPKLLMEGGTVELLLSTKGGSVNWETLKISLKLPDGIEEKHELYLSRWGSSMSGNAGQSLWVFDCRQKGIYRLTAQVNGEMDARPVRRYFDRTFHVKPAVSSNQYQGKPEPFIQQRN